MIKDDREYGTRKRREVLALLGAGTTLIAGYSYGQTSCAAADGASHSCVVTPSQTEGPYFVDERLHRSDIRVDPADGSMTEGLPLVLRLRVASISGSECKPLTGAAVDIWHCDARGAYSDVADMNSSSVGKKFLRGYQVTGADGRVQFTTIYPGSYPGRAVHIHFKVRAESKAAPAQEFTSQFYFQDSITDRVHAQKPYVKSGRRTRNDRDGIFLSGGGQLILPLVESTRGYTARFDVGLQMV